MRKGILILMGVALAALLLVAAGLRLSGRQAVRFDGDRVRSSDPERFCLRFEAMDQEDSEILSLQEGDALRVSWQIERGSVDIRIAMEGEAPVYQANDRGKGDAADFDLTIPRSGDYTVTVSARKAKGWVEFKQAGRE